jgi:hypothetical protein
MAMAEIAKEICQALSDNDSLTPTNQKEFFLNVKELMIQTSRQLKVLDLRR